MTFTLPKYIVVAPGPHGFNTQVLNRAGTVQIDGRDRHHCTDLARSFLGAVAKEMSAFTMTATYRHSDHPGKTWTRWIAVLRGGVVECSGFSEPRIYEP